MYDFTELDFSTLVYVTVFRLPLGLKAASLAASMTSVFDVSRLKGFEVLALKEFPAASLAVKIYSYSPSAQRAPLESKPFQETESDGFAPNLNSRATTSLPALTIFPVQSRTGAPPFFSMFCFNVKTSLFPSPSGLNTLS